MARDITAVALDVIAAGGRYATLCRVTQPGALTSEVNISPGWSVSERAPARGESGPSLGVSSLQLLPTDGIDDLFDFAGFPGSVYELRIGVNLGLSIEWFRNFTGYVADGSCRRNRLGVTVSLTDGWSWCDEPFGGEYTAPVGVSRASAAAEIFGPAIPGLTTLIEANGGYITTPAVYTGKRGEAVTAIARDGLLQVCFNGNGELVVRPQLDITGTLTPLWRFRSGTNDPTVEELPADPPTIINGTLERTRAWTESLYNAAIVRPGGSEQTWAAQTVRLADAFDKRHESKVGFRPYEYTSDTIANACDAKAVAEYALTYLLRGTSERVKVQVLLNPAIEKNDIFAISALPTLDDAGWAASYIATNVTHAPSEGVTSLEGVSALGYVLGQ